MLCKLKYITSIKRLLTCLRVPEVSEREKRKSDHCNLSGSSAHHSTAQCTCSIQYTNNNNNKLKCVSCMHLMLHFFYCLRYLKNCFKITIKLSIVCMICVEWQEIKFLSTTISLLTIHVTCLRHDTLRLMDFIQFMK